CLGKTFRTQIAGATLHTGSSSFVVWAVCLRANPGNPDQSYKTTACDCRCEPTIGPHSTSIIQLSYISDCGGLPSLAHFHPAFIARSGFESHCCHECTSRRRQDDN